MEPETLPKLAPPGAGQRIAEVELLVALKTLADLRKGVRTAFWEISGALDAADRYLGLPGLPASASRDLAQSERRVRRPAERDPIRAGCRIVELVAPVDLAYAVAPERGKYRGFAALHDVMDANLLLERVLGEMPGNAANSIDGWRATQEWIGLANLSMAEATRIMTEGAGGP